ncbi:MAG: hypothetical protein LBM00_11310 [Deltaproteobacteria bacterium]|jgi:hypothetical protein|nr:hypothetical protein [Deltaproteobacteria bacterium]
MIYKTNHRKIIVIVSLMVTLALSAGCALFNNNAAETPAAQGQPAEFYYGSFEDVPIPKEMKSTKEGYIVYAPGNVKLGMDVYSGRVEINSLNNAMEGYMANDGWSFYSGSRGPKQNVMVYTKGNFLSIITTTDGALNTEMRIYVTQKVK